MRPSVRINPAELDALKGLPLAARVLYIEGIRPFMDFVTGLVGASSSPDKSISLQSLAEVLYVEPRQGRTGTGSRSRKHARVCIEILTEAGLISTHSIATKNTKRLILNCLLADVDQSAQKKQGTNRAHYQVTNRAQGKANKNEALDSEETPKQGTPEAPKQGTPPETGKDKHTTTRARGLQPLPDGFCIDAEVQTHLAMTVVPIDFCKSIVDEFRLANTASGYQAHNWAAEFAKYCVKQWRYQQSFVSRTQSVGKSPRSSSVHHNIEADKDYLDGAEGFVTWRH